MRYRPRRPLKDRVLAEWRGYWEPQDVSKYEQEIESVVGKAMKGLGLKDRFNEEQVFEAWNEMVDNFIGSNARPVVLEKKVLSIQVLHSTVHYELERMKGQLLRRMQERFGAENIRDIRFRLG
jgi:predicted nucleic acid-binding Zn ribbon protein